MDPVARAVQQGAGLTLTPQAFERLLALLDQDREKAAEAYEALRGRTSGLLRWWGAPDADELADETLDRVARKLDEGAQVAPASLGAYTRGVARLVFYESRRRPRVEAEDLRAIAPPARDEGEAAACLDTCLEALLRPDRDLVLRYYADGKAADVRRRLAGELGLSNTALRIRAHRIREQLERCVSTCLARAS